MIKDVQYPAHVLHGIRPLMRGFTGSRSLRIFGADTETFNGLPISLQIAGPASSMDELSQGVDYFFCYTDASRIFSDFWAWLHPILRPNGVNICWFHNLNFDLRVLFKGQHLQIYEQFNDVELDLPHAAGPCKVRMLYGKVNKATVVCGGRRLQIFDSRAFTLTSLKKSLKMFAVPFDKLKSPPGLGRVDFSKLLSTDPARLIFEQYSRLDAVSECGLGVRILEFHREYDVTPSLSLPSFASKCFRRHFLRPGESVPFPPLEVARASELSTHGGKNGYYLPAPAVREDLYEVDINSAYPHAMAEFPPLTEGEWRRTRAYAPGLAGVYCLTGEVVNRGINRAYPLIWTHDFKPVRGGPFKGLWHTGHEVELILAATQNIRIDGLWGYVWLPGPGADNPFRRYVEHFYGKKESTPKSDPRYHMYKLALNALFGKLLSTLERKSFEEEELRRELAEQGVNLPPGLRIDERWDPVLKRFVGVRRAWLAGSMFNPFWGSQVTGHARAHLYKLEVSLQALHSATDSVKTAVPSAAVPGLGGVKVECFGRCYLFRNKLYLHFSKDSSHCGHGSKDKPFYAYPEEEYYRDGGGGIAYRPHPKAGQILRESDGQHLCKTAMHGFKGPLHVLFDGRHDLIRTGRLKYEYIHVIGLREGLRKRLTPCDFVVIPETLDLHGGQGEPEHLLTFILKRGGFSLAKEAGGYSGELKNWNYANARIRGLVNAVGGLSVDHMRELAAEALYVKDDLDITAFLDLVDRAVRGERVYGDNAPYEEPVEMEEAAT